ncbi:hypothetical protein HO173_009029 [Letharia columbiana]|uniref:Uncharacterized protein n=1 Tax=Letharia columbiana TaxID=112416 RepID=A0A8H6FQE3_9LECA|nr:uncharacterized protein HO173_009029 [Letharia columbiana]KAF6232815.1 hypothetical protein HO173_009029 [Letharia columbiana]
MAPQIASIQSFFQPETPSAQKTQKPAPQHHRPSDTGDGFSSSEIEAALHPALHKWQPRTTYNETDIGDLVPGPGCVALMGRIVNFHHIATPSKMPKAAQGCLKLTVKDDTGACSVKLWYAKVDYNLRLGLLVSIWTTHVSNAESSSLTVQDASLVTSIFPERDNSCYFLAQEQSDEGVMCKTPLGYRDGKQLDGLMTLKSFIEGGHELADGKILVCVKSIGGRKKFVTKKGQEAEKVDVNVFDDTADAKLTLWGPHCSSPAYWKTSYTVLLITRPGLYGDGRPLLSLTNNTHVDVDPCMTDAYWLRGHAQRLTKREHVNQPFPEGVFDVEEAAESELRIVFTLADIDEFVRAAPAERYVGYLSLTIVELNIYSLYQRNMLLCTECCGVPIFANAVTTKCKQCEKDLVLRINPRLVGLLIDETGAITCGKLVWSDDAWEQLLGRTAEDLAGSNLTLLKYLENRLLFLKLAVMFGWSEDVGKLCILRVTIV